MRQFRFDYSLKNIPIPSQDAYLRNLIEKVESVLKRMRWKAHFFLKGDKISNQNNPFGLPPNKIPPTILEMKLKFTVKNLTYLVYAHLITIRKLNLPSLNFVTLISSFVVPSLKF